MRRIIKFSLLQAILVYCAIWANEPNDKDEQVFPVDLSVFDGNGSLLLVWSFPDSILLRETRIYVQKSGDAEFNLLIVNPSDKQRFLDQIFYIKLIYLSKQNIEQLISVDHQ